MIVRMSKVRVLGPRDRLIDTLRVLQDFGLVHIAETTTQPGLEPVSLDPHGARRRRQLERIVADADIALEAFGAHAPAAEPLGTPATISDLARWARRARRARVAVTAIAAKPVQLSEELALIQRYRELLDALGPQLRQVSQSAHLVSHAVVVPSGERRTVEEAIAALNTRTDGGIVLRTRPLRSGDLAVLIVMPRSSAEQVEKLLTEARLPEISLPTQFRARSLADAVPMMLSRLEQIPREQQELTRSARALAREYGGELRQARAAAHDALARLAALEHSATSARAFAIEGWVPRLHGKRLVETLAAELGPLVVAEELATEEWVSEDAPVVLSNPRLFRPFEALVAMMPLPRYGTIDPTPFVAVFFPALFGIMLGDVGYGLILTGIAVLLLRRSKPGSPMRTIAQIMGPSALVAIVAGFLFGEFFGDLGRHTFGMKPIWFDREEALVAFLLVAVGIGVVHVLLGLVLAVLTRWRRERRHAIGSGVSAIMIVLIIVALLAAFEVLPGGLITPSVIALLVAFPILIALEGLIAPVELLSTLGNILSYARVMALGTASVMFAVVANRMAGAVGSAVVGFLLALLFHLVNFVIGVFSPTIHTLRLHYVEFFGKFYSPGGNAYKPLSHWRPRPPATTH
jgi:V/A-type H+-transporting ATPase subunit I